MYWVEVYNDTTGDDDAFFWTTGEYIVAPVHVATALEVPGQTWIPSGSYHLGIELIGEFIGADCNANSSPDACDIDSGDSLDCNVSGVPDECESFAPPEGTPSLDVDETTLSWTGLSGATGYQVVRGRSGPLVSSGGDFTSATEECLAEDHPTTSLPYTASPPAGQGYWFLVRGRNCPAKGTWDTGADSQSGSRDAGIDSSPHACP
jgi:hypothetical protein